MITGEHGSESLEIVVVIQGATPYASHIQNKQGDGVVEKNGEEQARYINTNKQTETETNKNSVIPIQEPA